MGASPGHELLPSEARSKWLTHWTSETVYWSEAAGPPESVPVPINCHRFRSGGDYFGSGKEVRIRIRRIGTSTSYVLRLDTFFALAFLVQLVERIYFFLYRTLVTVAEIWILGTYIILPYPDLLALVHNKKRCSLLS